MILLTLSNDLYSAVAKYVPLTLGPRVVEKRRSGGAELPPSPVAARLGNDMEKAGESGIPRAWLVCVGND